jgi:putative transposase
MRKKWKVTTKSNPKAEAAPNHLNQNFRVAAPNTVWISDITYIKTQEGWFYLAAILDLFSRKVVGLSMGESLETSLITKALKQALRHRKPKGALMHHSDRGCQYTSKEFKELTQKYGINLSMSAKRLCYEMLLLRVFFTLSKQNTQNIVTLQIEKKQKLVFLSMLRSSITAKGFTHF